MKVFYWVLFSFFISVSNGQDLFSVHILPSSINSTPAIHSGAFAKYNGKWIFIGGRIDGLHIMQANQAFPYYGRNDSVFVVDPVLNNYHASAISDLPFILYEALGSSNMQYYQDGSHLYMIGGYGKSDSTGVYTTFPSLISIDLDCLTANVSAGSSINSCFRQIQDSVFAVSGGELEKIDSTYYLVFGHRFDGAYAETPQLSNFVQRYTNEIRKFKINDDGINLSISNYSAIVDTDNFHRRDFNLVPQIFPSGLAGVTAFGGVFQKTAIMPYLTPIDITTSNVTHQSSFNQNLNQYTAAHLPIFDIGSNAMHTVFFGGMSLYTLDTTSHSLVQDTLIPFVKTISKVSRDVNGTLSESQMNESMPFYLGTNAFFIPDTSVHYLNGKILDINSLSGNTRVGFIVGGIKSDSTNIAHLDPSGMSRPNAQVYEVFIDKTIDQIGEVAVDNHINNLFVYPNPAHEVLNIDFEIPNSGKCELAIYSVKGKLVRNLFNGLAIEGKKHFSFSTEGIKSGIYLCRIISGNSKKIVKVIIE